MVSGLMMQDNAPDVLSDSQIVELILDMEDELANRPSIVREVIVSYLYVIMSRHPRNYY